MESKRRKKIGIKIKTGATIYSYATSKEIKLTEDIVVSNQDIMLHEGHIRFNYKGKRYAYTYNTNRGKYENMYE
jgi:hypothetical protein